MSEATIVSSWQSFADRVQDLSQHGAQRVVLLRKLVAQRHHLLAAAGRPRALSEPSLESGRNGLQRGAGIGKDRQACRIGPRQHRRVDVDADERPGW
jgi:hypothetical protein